MSKTSSGGQAMGVVAVTRNRAILSRRRGGFRPGACLATGDEDVLAAVVVERLSLESAVESFEVQARDVEESQPFVLGRPPERAGPTVVQGDVDSVVADAVVVRVRHRYSGVGVGVPPVDRGCNAMVEGERVPGEATVGQQRRRDALEAAATFGPRGQMQERPAGAVDQRRGLLELELTDDAFAQVELDSLLSRARSC